VGGDAGRQHADIAFQGAAVAGCSARQVKGRRGGGAGGGRVLDGDREYISVTNQNELVHAEVLLERQMLSRFPAAEQEELAGYFRR
jgi:hypothetical protein